MKNSILNVNLKNDFWIFYVEPMSQMNGIDTKEGIDSIRFCQCTFLKKDSENRLMIMVDNVIGLDDSAKLLEEDVLPEIWKKLVGSSETVNSINMTFGDYEILSVDLEGDVGLVLIAKHDLHKSRIIMVNDWDFHRNVYYRTNIKLNNKAKKKGI